MTDEQNQGGFQKPMYDVDEKCGKCGAAITKLPFQPDPGRRDQLKCIDCFKKERSS